MFRDNRICSIEYINSLMNHSLLADMPSATNTDHDGRYYTETETDTLISNLVDGTTAFTAIDINGGDITGVTISGSLTWSAAQNFATGTTTIATCDINAGAIDGVTIGTNSPCTELQVDYININGNTILNTDEAAEPDIDITSTFGKINLSAAIEVTVNSVLAVGITTAEGTLRSAAGGATTHNFNYFDCYSDDAPYQTFLYLRKSNSNTLGTKTTTVDGDSIGVILFTGVDSGSNFDQGAGILAVQNGAAGTRVPCDLKFQTATSTALNANQFLLNTNGNVGINTATPDTKLQVVGDSKFGDDNTNYVEIGTTGDTKFVGGAGLVFGSFWGNEIAFVVAGGTGTFSVVTDSDITAGQTHNTTFQNNQEIDIGAFAGMYLVTYSVTMKGTGANKHLVSAIGVDVGGVTGDVAQNDGRSHSITVGNAELSMGGTAILDLSANDEVSIMVTNETDNTNIIVEHVALSTVQIGGT